MMRYAVCLLLFALSAGAASAQATVPLTISGDTVTVVKSLPFKITAPEGASVYVWNHPSTVTSEEADNVLTVTAAPVGEITVKIQTIYVDFKNSKVTKLRGQVTFVVGKIPPPGPEPQPGPSPTPETALQKSVREAYAADPNPEKARHVKSLAVVYREGARAVTESKPVTIGAVWKALEAGAKAAGVGGKVMVVQRAIQEELSKLPTKSSTVLDDAMREKIVTIFRDVAVALERLEVKSDG